MAAKIKIDHFQRLLSAANNTIDDLLRENYELGMRQGDQQQDHAGRRDGDAAPRTPHDPGDDGADEGAEASDAMGFMVPPCSQFGNIQFGMCRGWRRFFGSQCLRRT